MSVLKCPMCGGTVELEDNGGFIVCTYCGTRQAISQNDAPNDVSDSTIDNAQINALRIENERRKAQEARVQAEQNRLKAESQRLERERLAEKSRIEKQQKSKARRKIVLRILLSFFIVISLSIITTTVIIPSVKYHNAMNDIEEKNYEQAYLILKSLRKFKDSKAQADSLLREYPYIAQIGDTIFFGKYEQDNKTSNGAEEIEWKVLDKDQDGKMLVVSKYALDCRHYHSSATQVTWETSDIRKWLNNDFISTAFTKSEKDKINTTTLENRDNADYNTDGGNSTKDKVFLLSIDETLTYFPLSVDRVCLATKYAESHGSQLEKLTRSCRWWLRSPGSSSYTASAVKVDGFVLQMGAPVSGEKRSIRPAMWIDF